MAINFFQTFSPLEIFTPSPRKVGLMKLFGRDDMHSDRRRERDLQRRNDVFMQEPEEYDEVRELGFGGNGKAILLERRKDRSLLVVKIVKPFPGWSTTTIATEVFLLRHRLPENDRIIRVKDYLHSAHVPQIQIYLEYCDGGDLAQLLNRYHYYGRTLPESFAWHAFRQIAEGLAFIHHGYDHKLGPNQVPQDTWKQVIHADLKPENIFLRRSKVPGHYPNLVLGDFGNSYTEQDFHRAGTWTWLPPERKFVSGMGDTWTMGAIISSLAWRGTPPPRPERWSHRTFHRGIVCDGPPILIRHQFGRPEPDPQLHGIPGTDQCQYEREAVFVRPMLSYSYELNDLVAHTSHPHIHTRLTSWDCLQIIWYEMEVGAARSQPFVPLMFGWEEPLPASVLNHGNNAAAPAQNGRADDDNSDHRSSSNDSSDHGQDPPDQGRTRKRKRTTPEESGRADDDNSDHRISSNDSSDHGQDPPDQGRTRKRKRTAPEQSGRADDDNSDHRTSSNDSSDHGQDPPDQGRTGKRKRTAPEQGGHAYYNIVSDHRSSGNDSSDHGQDPPDRERTRKRKRIEEDGDDEGSPGRRSTGKRRHGKEDSDKEN